MIKKIILGILFIIIFFIASSFLIYHHYSITLKQSLNQASTQTNSNYKTAYKGSGVEDIISEKTLKEYEAEFLEADDEYDYRYPCCRWYGCSRTAVNTAFI